MAGAKGRTGNPGTKNPDKKNSTSYAAEPGVEPKKGRVLSFRPVPSLEKRVDKVLSDTGLAVVELLELATLTYIEKSPKEILQDLEQLKLEKRQLDSRDSTEEPATTASDETPASGSSNARTAGRRHQAQQQKQEKPKNRNQSQKNTEQLT
jgi:hypothetical protein